MIQSNTTRYAASVEEMAYIGSTWVKTVMWPVMMQTILKPNVQEKKWRRLAGLLGGWWQHKSRIEISCYVYWLTIWIIYLWLIPHWQHGLLQSCNFTLQGSLYSYCFIYSSNQSIPFLERVDRSGAILAATFALLRLADSLAWWTAATEFSLPS